MFMDDACAGAAGAAGHGAPDGVGRARAVAPVLHRGARRRGAGHAAGAARARACLRGALRRLFWQRPRGYVAGAAARARVGLTALRRLFWQRHRACSWRGASARASEGRLFWQRRRARSWRGASARAFEGRAPAPILAARPRARSRCRGASARVFEGCTPPPRYLGRSGACFGSLPQGGSWCCGAHAYEGCTPPPRYLGFRASHACSSSCGASASTSVGRASAHL